MISPPRQGPSRERDPGAAGDLPPPLRTCGRSGPRVRTVRPQGADRPAVRQDTLAPAPGRGPSGPGRGPSAPDQRAPPRLFLGVWRSKKASTLLSHLLVIQSIKWMTASWNASLWSILFYGHCRMHQLWNASLLVTVLISRIKLQFS
jgi:hypothetical protein